MSKLTKLARKCLRVFVLLISILSIQIYFIKPVFAFTSLNSCFKNPVCAQQIVSNYKVKQYVGQSVISPFTRVVNVTGKVNKSFSFQNVANYLLGFASGAGIGVGILKEQDIKDLQDKARSDFCSEYEASVCGDGFVLKFYSTNNRKWFEVEVLSYNVYKSGNQSFPDYMDIVRKDETETTYAVDPESIEEIPNPPLDWDDIAWDNTRVEDDEGELRAPRQIALDLLTQQDLEEAITEVTVVDLPDMQLFEDESITVDVDEHLKEQGKNIQFVPGAITFNPGDEITNNSGEKLNIPEPKESNTTTKKYTFEKTNDGEYIIKEEVIVVEENEQEEGGEEGEENNSSEDNFEDDVALESPLIEPIQPLEFPQQNWFEYGRDQLSNKFPFDVFGDFSATNIADDCPTYTFFDRDFELCVIRDVLKIFKYPVIVGFIIWSYQNI